MADAKGILYPGMTAIFQSTPTLTNFTLNGSTDQLEIIFELPPGAASFSITRLGIRLATITGTTPTYKISLQGMDASGNPDGTIKGGGTPASKIFSPSGLGWAAGTFNWLTLDNAYSGSPGEKLALVVAYDSGTVDGSNNAAFTTHVVNASSNWPYSIQNDAGSRTRQSALPCFGWGTASKAYGFPLKNGGSLSFINTATPDEYAMKFTLASAFAQSYKISAARFSGVWGAGNSTLMSLYEGTTTLQDKLHDGDAGVSTSTARQNILTFDESALSALILSGTYRIAFAPQNAFATVLAYIEVENVADWEAWPGGADFGYSTRTDSGAWTDTDTRRLLVDFILTDVTTTVTGRILVHPGMSGGVRG
jgi:hypothetical protein